MERRGRATAPATAAPTGAAPAQPTSMDMFMPSTMPELRVRDDLGTFLKRFRTWVCLNRYDLALDSEIAANTSGTSRVELERLHDNNLVENILKAWQVLKTTLEKEKGTLNMVMDVGSLSEAWWALTKIAAEMPEAA